MTYKIGKYIEMGHESGLSRIRIMLTEGDIGFIVPPTLVCQWGNTIKSPSVIALSLIGARPDLI